MDKDIERFLQFITDCRKTDVPFNQAAILMYIYLNPGCEQKDMQKPLDMSSNLLCNAIRVLLAYRLIIQDEVVERKLKIKKHRIAAKGKEKIKLFIGQKIE